jgi:hypothetical protein
LSPQNNGGTTVLDPGFNGFTSGNSIGAGSGWYNGNPPNLQGQAGADGKVELAQFAFVLPVGQSLNISGILSLTTTVGTSSGQAVQGTFQLCPVPSVLAAFCIGGGLLHRRRRV